MEVILDKHLRPVDCTGTGHRQLARTRGRERGRDGERLRVQVSGELIERPVVHAWLCHETSATSTACCIVLHRAASIGPGWGSKAAVGVSFETCRFLTTQ